MTERDKSRFFDYLRQHNNLAAPAFKRWVFAPGMAFQDMETWWPGGRRRSHPHEGVDFQQYMDWRGNSHALPAKTKIPAMQAGTVIDIFEDFLGKSILLAHGRADDRVLHAVYGHITPAAGLAINNTVRAGEIIATLVAPVKADIPPHLHLSILVMTRQARFGEIRWESINDPALGRLCNPLDYL